MRDVKATEHLEEATAMHKLLHLGYRLFLAEQYRAGRISLRDVALRMNTSLSDAMDALRRLGDFGYGRSVT